MYQKRKMALEKRKILGQRDTVDKLTMSVSDSRDAICFQEKQFLGNEKRNEKKEGIKRHHFTLKIHTFFPFHDISFLFSQPFSLKMSFTVCKKHFQIVCIKTKLLYSDSILQNFFYSKISRER